MSESWRRAKASEVVVGDRVRTDAGDLVEVSRIESPFMGRGEMLAFIEDTAERWYKRPVPADAELDILVEV